MLTAALSVASLCWNYSWVNQWRVAEIKDPSIPTTLLLSAPTIEGWPEGIYGVQLSIVGDIGGEIEITVENSEPQRLSGKVNWGVTHDWFSKNCNVTYRPIGKVSGDFRIEYRFHCMPW